MSAPKDGTPSERFDKILYHDLSDERDWVRLGKGSFGCVYKGDYLGIEVAIKEVLSSTEYDVEKYLQREITLMQQARHPNIVQFIGLCLAPPNPPSYLDSTPSPAHARPRILIISEYLPRGNLRQYILDRTLPFPWRLRLSFSIDIARALAYLHARNCMHRDLKGENLLVTENERLKCCDFGLARIVDKEQGLAEVQRLRPLTYCGTDGYMSPEILLGQPFTLSTDVFSLGVLFLEIASRTLTSQHTFVRVLPDYGINPVEVDSLISPHCPRRFVDLALRCCATEPEQRPAMKEILAELREIEREVLSEADRAEMDAHVRGAGMTASMKGHVGSISYAGTMRRGSSAKGGGRPRPSAPRLPSFEGKVNLMRGSSFGTTREHQTTKALGHTPRAGGGGRDSSESEDDGEALLALAEADVPIDEEDSQYSTSVVKPASTIIPGGGRPYGRLGSKSGSSFFGGEEEGERSGGSLPSLPPSWIATASSHSNNPLLVDDDDEDGEGAPTVIARSSPSPSPSSPASPDNSVSFLTARTSTLSVADAVVGHSRESSDATIYHDADADEDEARDVFHSAIQSPPAPLPTIASPPSPAPTEALHRFSLIKPGLQRFLGSFAPHSSSSAGTPSTPKEDKRMSWEMLGRMESGQVGLHAAGGMGTGRCSLCGKKFGLMKAYLCCDDCGLCSHIKCSDSVTPSCPAFLASSPLPHSASPSPTLPTHPSPPMPTRAIPSPPNSRAASKERPSKLIKKQKAGGGVGGKTSVTA
ncbi:hypothetical protein JCM5296_002724 [Sporobolomyces johnsonii]